jgi:hypothetical protein
VVWLCRHLHWFLHECLREQSGLQSSRATRPMMQHALTCNSYPYWIQVLGRHIKRVAAELVSCTRSLRHLRGTATPPVGNGTWETGGPAREW